MMNKRCDIHASSSNGILADYSKVAHSNSQNLIEGLFWLRIKLAVSSMDHLIIYQTQGRGKVNFNR